MRRLVMITLLVAGFALQAVAYFLLGAPLGIPTSPAFSNPRLSYAALVFIVGVVLVLVAAVVYELLPEHDDGEQDGRGVNERSAVG